MHRVVFIAGQLGHFSPLRFLEVFEPQVFKRQWQTDCHRNIHHLLNLSHRRSFHHELGEQAEHDLFSVLCAVQIMHTGHPVMDRMRSGTTSRLSPDSGHVDGGFNRILQGGSNGFLLHRECRLGRIFFDGFVARLGNRKPDQCGF
ncbi:hypothetical protein D3C87_1559280 [compost metagenome]